VIAAGVCRAWPARVYGSGAGSFLLLSPGKHAARNHIPDKEITVMSSIVRWRRRAEQMCARRSLHSPISAASRSASRGLPQPPTNSYRLFDQLRRTTGAESVRDWRRFSSVLQTVEQPIIAGSGGIPDAETVGLPAIGGRSADVATLQALVGRLQRQVNDLQRQRHELSTGFNHLDEQIRLASQVQQDLLPQSVAIDGLEVHTLYRPVDRVSGDIYDITRLDETHLGISMADASGHGMPAALLTCMLKRSFRGKDIFRDSYEILDPSEVLRRVNQDLLDTNFRQCQFVTGMYAVYYHPARTLTFARGGQPYPLLVRQGCPPRQLVTEGPLIGAFEAADFQSMTVYLEPGDTLIVGTSFIGRMSEIVRPAIGVGASATYTAPTP